ncbi:MAG: bifunctional diaminohydroxyphosphoribosylaminopyrimidine deaminase/5-amino-6-(5-phosphoribosylamino)uracil reductase RibD [Halothece sp. Uz-M2-17]|nr:bifunctional diaminohydroxyphosphoribosylaminopyrimidine deaminase/5-amino-6-(5-phosphoribosylamino)uracil reductase RibD [Halothece sp. Uz-M2-17]
MDNLTPPTATGTPFDRAMMQRCLQLARQGIGKTSPNPLVGAVVVQNGKIVGEGYHPGIGQPHAEVFALREAGEKAKWGTLYVNLEPCNHYGRTPPCSEAIIQVGIKKVVIGMADPNATASGGKQRLEAAGISVLVGVEEKACRELNAGFIHRILYQRPFGIFKYAMTLDGKIATTMGHSAWVTDLPARKRVYQERSQCDAIIVGGNTVRQDNPYLTTHQLTTQNPLRIVMTRTLDLSPEAHIFQVDEAPTLVLTEQDNLEATKQLEKQGVEVLQLSPLTPSTVMNYLYERGLARVLWECGGTLAAKAIKEGVIQQILAFIAPKIIGGVNAPTPVGDLDFKAMTEALVLEEITWEQLGDDYLLIGKLVRPASR